MEVEEVQQRTRSVEKQTDVEWLRPEDMRKHMKEELVAQIIDAARGKSRVGETPCTFAA